MLTGHRFERTAQGDLHIHSRNFVQTALTVLAAGLAFVLPLAFAVFALGSDSAPLADVDALAALLIVLGVLLIAALGLVLVVYTGCRETLLLSRRDGEGKRRSRNFFGRRERVLATFRIDKPKHLELRRRPGAASAYTQLWLVMRDGSEQRLTTDNVPVIPGKKVTEVWLRELADYLQVAVPTEVVDDSSASAKPIYRPAPSPAKTARQRKAKALTPAQEPADKLGIPARALLTLLGAFLAVLELTNVIAIAPAVFTGRLHVGGFRTGSTTFYWAEHPMFFAFNLLVGLAEVAIIGFIAWNCLRIAIRGRMKTDASGR